MLGGGHAVTLSQHEARGQSRELSRCASGCSPAPARPDSARRAFPLEPPAPRSIILPRPLPPVMLRRRSHSPPPAARRRHDARAAGGHSARRSGRVLHPEGAFDEDVATRGIRPRSLPLSGCSPRWRSPPSLWRFPLAAFASELDLQIPAIDTSYTLFGMAISGPHAAGHRHRRVRARHDVRSGDVQPGEGHAGAQEHARRLGTSSTRPARPTCSSRAGC